jgi:hypothetical protein
MNFHPAGHLFTASLLGKPKSCIDLALSNCWRWLAVAVIPLRMARTCQGAQAGAPMGTMLDHEPMNLDVKWFGGTS